MTIDLISVLVAAGMLVFGFVCGWKGRGAVERHTASCPQCRRRLLAAGESPDWPSEPHEQMGHAFVAPSAVTCEHGRPMNRWCRPCGRDTAHLFRPVEGIAAGELGLKCRRCGAPAMDLASLCADCSKLQLKGDA